MIWADVVRLSSGLFVVRTSAYAQQESRVEVIGIHMRLPLFQQWQ